jgi:hypothetical protein
MREVFTSPTKAIAPSLEDLFRAQGIPAGRAVSPAVAEIARNAIDVLNELARPVAVVEDVPVDEFDSIYAGEGLNDATTPLGEIFPTADRLALFAGTVGEGLSSEIQRLFDAGDLASAVMLDAAASEATERFVAVLEGRFARGQTATSQAVLAYSPGYCGWHVSGQRRLFAKLQPTECGITLNSSCLMAPLKSVSGVLVAGRPEIHDFEDDYECCAVCATRECRVRIERILEV